MLALPADSEPCAGARRALQTGEGQRRQQSRVMLSMNNETHSARAASDSKTACTSILRYEEVAYVRDSLYALPDLCARRRQPARDADNLPA